MKNQYFKFFSILMKSEKINNMYRVHVSTEKYINKKQDRKF